MVVSSSSIRGLGIRGRRSDFHRAETGRHSFESVIWEELVLEEAEESEELVLKVASGGTSDLLMRTRALYVTNILVSSLWRAGPSACLLSFINKPFLMVNSVSSLSDRNREVLVVDGRVDRLHARWEGARCVWIG